MGVLTNNKNPDYRFACFAASGELLNAVTGNPD